MPEWQGNSPSLHGDNALVLQGVSIASGH